MLIAAVMASVTTMIASPAFGQAIDTASLIRRTCMDATRDRPEVERQRLAALILADQGILTNRPEDRLRLMLTLADSAPREIQERVRRVAYRLAEQLDTNFPTSPVDLGIEASPRDNLDEEWRLFRDDVRLFCRFKDEDQPAQTTQGTTIPARGGGRGIFEHLRLRQNPDALTATGSARLKAGSAQVGYERERVITNGTSRTDSTFSIEAALGFAIQDDPRTSLLIFAGYELERARSNPPPQLPVGTSQSDDDTNVLQLGFVGHHLVSTDAASIMFVGSGSVILDHVKESERLRFNLSASPAFGPFPGGLCYFGGYAPPIDIGFAHLRGRCTLTFLGQVNHVFDAGLTTPGAADEFALAGARIGLDLATGTDSGVIAGATYEYQRRLHGDVPSIDRFTAHLKYRHWFRDRHFGIDFGFDFADGINTESFADENRLRFGIGFIF